MGLLEEIWEQDTTLINVLDETGVTELPTFKTRVNTIEQEQIYQKSQLDSLGNTLNHYQQSTEADLALINTRLDNSNELLEQLNSKVSKINENIDELSFTVNRLNTEVVKLKEEFNKASVDLADVITQIKLHNQEIDGLQRRMDSTVQRLNAIEPSVKLNTSFLGDSTAIFQGSRVVIVDIGGSTVEWSYTTIGEQYGRQISSPCKFAVRYSLQPVVRMNNTNYIYIMFTGIGRTTSQPVTSQDTLISWGYQQIRLFTESNTSANFSVFMIKQRYDSRQNKINKYV